MALTHDSADLARRFGGLDRLYGVAPAQAIAQAHVVVVGIGGVGSWTAEALGRSGVSHLTLIDMDHIAESNITRQVHALTDTLGMAKGQAMQARIAQIHPGCQVNWIDDFVTPENVQSLLPASIDAVVDACDDVPAKLALMRWARTQRVPHVCVGAAGGKRQPQRVEVADLALVTHDPLLAKLRYRLRREDGAPRDGRPLQVACVFSREAVAPPDPSCALGNDGSLNCHGYGSSVTVTATFGLCAAAHAIEEVVRRSKKA